MPLMTLAYILLVLAMMLVPLVLLQSRKPALHWMFLGLALSQAATGAVLFFAILASVKANAEPAYHDTYYVVASFHAFANPVLISAVLAIFTGLLALARAPLHRSTGIIAFWVFAVSCALMTTPSLQMIEATGYAEALAMRPYPPFTALVLHTQNLAGIGYILSLGALLLLLIVGVLAKVFKLGGTNHAP